MKSSFAIFEVSGVNMYCTNLESRHKQVQESASDIFSNSPMLREEFVSDKNS